MKLSEYLNLIVLIIFILSSKIYSAETTIIENYIVSINDTEIINQIKYLNRDISKYFEKLQTSNKNSQNNIATELSKIKNELLNFQLKVSNSISNDTIPIVNEIKKIRLQLNMNAINLKSNIWKDALNYFLPFIGLIIGAYLTYILTKKLKNTDVKRNNLQGFIKAINSYLIWINHFKTRFETIKTYSYRILNEEFAEYDFSYNQPLSEIFNTLILLEKRLNEVRRVTPFNKQNQVATQTHYILNLLENHFKTVAFNEQLFNQPLQNMDLLISDYIYFVNKSLQEKYSQFSIKMYEVAQNNFSDFVIIETEQNIIEIIELAKEEFNKL